MTARARASGTTTMPAISPGVVALSPPPVPSRLLLVKMLHEERPIDEREACSDSNTLTAVSDNLIPTPTSPPTCGTLEEIK
jgi:hypothetical protein